MGQKNGHIYFGWDDTGDCTAGMRRDGATQAAKKIRRATVTLDNIKFIQVKNREPYIHVISGVVAQLPEEYGNGDCRCLL
jgi:hypothetical protein